MKTELLKVKKPVQHFLKKISNLDENEVKSNEITQKAKTLLGSNTSNTVLEIGKYYKNVNLLIKKLEEKMKPFLDKKQELLKLRKNARTVVQNVMEDSNETKVESLEVSITLQKCTPSCVIAYEDDVPKKFFKLVKKFDKRKINRSFKDGKPVKGVEYIDDKITIKIQ